MPATFRSSTTTVPQAAASRVVSWCSPSSRRFAARACTRAIRAWVVRQRAEGCCPVRRSGPARRAACRLSRRSRRWACSSGRGLGTIWPVDSTARCVMPTSTPTVSAGRAGTRSARSTSTENEACQRPRRQDTVTDRIRAVPASIRRASVRVDSCVRTSPILGSRTCRRSAPASPNDPVENRTLGAARLPLNAGNLIAGPCGCRPGWLSSSPARRPGSPARRRRLPWSSPPTTAPPGPWPG